MSHTHPGAVTGGWPEGWQTAAGGAWQGAGPRPRPRSHRRTPGPASCEPLEGRRLLSTAGSGLSGGYALLGVSERATPVRYYINPAGSGLSTSFIKNAVSRSAKAWDAATSQRLFGGYTVSTTVRRDAADGKSVISFANRGNNGVLALTSLRLDGSMRHIVEFDMVFNTYYRWGDAAKNHHVYDLQSIAAHELGHALGLGDVAAKSRSAVTMYMYGAPGQTFRRTLEAADIAGLRAIYGL